MHVYNVCRYRARVRVNPHIDDGQGSIRTYPPYESYVDLESKATEQGRQNQPEKYRGGSV